MLELSRPRCSTEGLQKGCNPLCAAGERGRKPSSATVVAACRRQEGFQDSGPVAKRDAGYAETKQDPRNQPEGPRPTKRK
jgi:hypothetical protein